MHHGEIKLVRTLFMVTRGQGNKNRCHTITTFINTARDIDALKLKTYIKHYGLKLIDTKIHGN